MAWVYGIQSGLFIKIGVANNIPARLKTMNLYNPHPRKVVMRRQCMQPYIVEKKMHQILAPHSIGREWFMVDAPLVRAVATIAIREAEDERIAWDIECARREEERKARKAAGVLDVELVVDKS